ncbi:MAG: PD-(D/E)XK nuclease family protein [Meiothermus sp.]|nr:PD-(D/E)XK nuclease family protein [Meiothermus sp.]
MVWSFSGAKSFDRCQRQWYFKKKMAHHSAKEPLRREAYLLSKMDSLWSWRGKLVDQVIVHDLLPLLVARREPSLTYLQERARLRFDRQREFALRHRIREPGCKPSSAGEEFAAFSAVERGTPPTEEELESAWSEVALALEHLLSMGDLLNGLRRADVLLGQRQINFKVENFDRESVTVQANPDLIALFRQAPPLIVDWKVHTFGSTDYRRQLSVYALACLFQTNRARFFGVSRGRISAKPSQG